MEHQTQFRFDLHPSKFCKCSICQIAKTNGLLAKAMRRKAGRTCKDKRPIKVCSHCFIELNLNAMTDELDRALNYRLGENL